jgi:primosomal protein N' (replication factor Y)
VSGKTAHDELIQKLEAHKIDILVGTQMVVKGLDFEKVDVVGVLDADSLLNFADFRVHERAFQLMEQVSGRAGRKDANGKVIIQVAQINHPVLQFVMKHDYRAFYDYEIEGRMQFVYPPFSRIIHLSFRHRNKDVVAAAASFFSEKMKQHFAAFMVGPAEPVVNRVRNQFIIELMFKIPRDSGLVRHCKEAIRFNEAVMRRQDQFKGVLLTADIDPLS